jgi:hypothetical protein
MSGLNWRQPKVSNFPSDLKTHGPRAKVSNFNDSPHFFFFFLWRDIKVGNFLRRERVFKTAWIVGIVRSNSVALRSVLVGSKYGDTAFPDPYPWRSFLQRIRKVL